MDVESFVRGVVGVFLPQKQVDGATGRLRAGKYLEQYTIGLLRKQHAHADEGSYFTCGNNQSGIATPAVTAFATTTPGWLIVNTNTAASGLRIYIDYLNLVTTVAGGWASAGVNTQIMVYIDQVNRYSSGGTDLSANFVNTSTGSSLTPGCKFYAGAITATAAQAQRAVAGFRILRPAVSATVADVVGETKMMNFGGVEAMLNGTITVGSANQISIPLPAIVLDPQSSCLIYYVMNGTTPSAASFVPELGIIQR